MTPTEELIMELLAARYRLGETIWTIDSRHKKVLENLESEGWIVVIHGIVEKTLRAGLTEKGRNEYLDERYVPPILKEKK